MTGDTRSSSCALLDPGTLSHSPLCCMYEAALRTALYSSTKPWRSLIQHHRFRRLPQSHLSPVRYQRHLRSIQYLTRASISIDACFSRENTWSGSFGVLAHVSPRIDAMSSSASTRFISVCYSYSMLSDTTMCSLHGQSFALLAPVNRFIEPCLS